MALVCFAQAAAADDVKNHELIYGYLSGTYPVVGQKPGRDGTYSGRVIFDGIEDHLIATRKIQGQTIESVGTIEHALGPDEANVLRVQFTRDGQKFEITYLWRSDLDNYPRQSGYVYQTGGGTVTPGLKALFINPSTKQTPDTGLRAA